MEVISLIIGLLVGAVIAFIIFLLLSKVKNVSRIEFDELNSKYNNTETSLKVLESKSHDLQEINDSLSNKINAKENEVTQLNTKATSLEEKLINSDSRIKELSEKLTKEQMENKSRQDEINQLKQEISELKANNSFKEQSLAKLNDANDKQEKKIGEQNSEITELKSQISRLTESNVSLNDKLATQKTEIEDLQKTAHLQFEKIANSLLEEKAERFTATNKTNIETLLTPFKEDINKFIDKVESSYIEETKQRTSLDERIKWLVEQTNKVSAEANNLATALKGKPQKRGSWGEMILEKILEMSGLTKDREYFVQQTVKNDEGKQQRPDVTVKLPDERFIIIDSKVSLIAYDKYSTSEDSEEQKRFLIEHINATKQHIDQLSEKKYDDIEESLDFTMMFVPIEPALLLAIQDDSDLWSYAYSKRVLLVGPTTLIACIKLFADLWRREWQNKNAIHIAKRGERLYEKLVGFSKTFEEINKALNTAQEAYVKAYSQLSQGKDNAINQALKLKDLGLKSEKKFSEKLLQSSKASTEIG